MKTAAITLSLLILMFTHLAVAQSLPSKIRGYKVYEANVTITNATDSAVRKDGSDAVVKILDPRIVSVGLLGATVEVGAEFTANKQSGSIDFITCRDLRVNGIAIEVEEYTHPFAFKKGEKITLPKPATILIKTANIAKSAFKDLVDPKKDWSVTGTVFVFGKFKRFGFTFRRVVPVKIDLTIMNPLKKA